LRYELVFYVASYVTGELVTLVMVFHQFAEIFHICDLVANPAGVTFLALILGHVYDCFDFLEDYWV
jgi:hypothetical protein